jgi:hypothetical protein
MDDDTLVLAVGHVDVHGCDDLHGCRLVRRIIKRLVITDMVLSEVLVPPYRFLSMRFPV